MQTPSTQSVRFATQGDEHLVEVPCATGLASRCFRPVSKALAELVTPASDRLVGHDHPTLEEQLLDVAQARLKAEIPAYSATDDFSRETMTVIQRFRFLHRAILRDRLNNLTMPAPQIPWVRHLYFAQVRDYDFAPTHQIPVSAA